MNSKAWALFYRTAWNRVAHRVSRSLARQHLRRCGVAMNLGAEGESLRIGRVELSPAQAASWIPSLRMWAARLSGGGFRIAIEPELPHLLLCREGKVVALPPVRTLADYLGGILNHWSSVEVDELRNVRAIAGVSIEGQTARTHYRGRWLEYKVESNWMADSLEEVMFWGDLLPNYYYRVGAPPSGGSVLDLGAYHGLFGLAAAIDVGPQGHVFCFEPDARSQAAIESNVRRNNLQNIEVVSAGAAGRTEKRSFVSLGTFGSHLGGASNNTREMIQVYSLPDCCRFVGVSWPAFIKADIEGAELEAVESCQAWLAELRSTVFSIASYHIVNEEPTKLPLEQAFRRAGYQVATTLQGHQTTVAWRSE